MHILFTIPELVEPIVKHLIVPGSRFSKKSSELSYLSDDAYRDITAVGQTARLFRESSLDAIWRVQISLLPLMRAVDFEMKIMNIVAGGVPFKLYNILKLLNTDDATRILWTYSSRISELRLQSFPIILAYSDTIFAGLFPRLQVLKSPADNITQTHLVLHGTGDMLERLDVLGSPCPIPLLEDIAAKASRLKHLALQWTHDDPVHEPREVPDHVYVNFIEAFQKASLLEVLHVVAKFDNGVLIWKTLTQIASLTQLTLDLRGSPRVPFEELAEFSTLVSFHLIASDTLRYPIDLLAKCTFRRLQTLGLRFNCRSPPTLDEATHLITAIAASNPSATLRSLQIETYVVRPWTVVPIRPHAVKPLLRFPIIQHLDLGGHWCWDLDDDFMRELANAWPDLEVLRLDVTRNRPVTSRITVSGLEALVQYCPRLRDLDLTFSGTIPKVLVHHSIGTVELDVLAGGKQNEVLTCIGEGCSDVDSPVELAAILGRMFPELRVLEAAKHSFRKQWREVRDHLPANLNDHP
ncbi:hypothetical protein BXZ70DRAFT_772036 [Cristinia sonorae]|uniref:F-box domain-containing protein n=1 Tax=Cristinia sonorae TaxID=1940300 RepID=A0A8K0UTW0_9AGAR|nr:hypothetical protein BXZ70DRAFT_772036 [Cristinia sonorae]